MQHAEHLGAILDFLAGIGLVVRAQALPEGTFLPGLAIRDGALLYDPERLQWPGDLLHEAGHLAVLPAALRARASDDLADAPQAEHAGELEALAWSYAAALAAGVPLPVLFHPGGYKGQSDSLLQTMALGIVPGLRGLCAAGLTEARGFSDGEVTQPFPAMRRWLRD